MEGQRYIGTANGWLEQLREERQTIAALAERINLGPKRRCDIHLCYGDVPDIAFKGFLITWLGNLDRLVAFCPVMSHRMRHGSHRLPELKRAFVAVMKIAASPEIARRSPDVLWLGSAGDMERPVPGWVYGLRCVPMAGEWDGEFKSPRPFCPELFEQMARQPQAVRWLAQQSFPNPRRPHGQIADGPPLPARVRQVLTCLKSGYSEKETASELGVSKHTIHVHVKRIYRHFQVHSRGELLSLFVKSISNVIL